MPFRLPTRVTIRPGALGLLPDLLRKRRIERVLLVYDEGIGRAPWTKKIQVRSL